MTSPSPDSRRVEEMLADHARRLMDVEEGLKSAQLAHSTIDDGVLAVRAPDGTTLSTWGVQPDGTAGTRSFNKIPPPPPVATTPTPLIAGMDVPWGGLLVGNMPSDFRCVNVHVSLVKDFTWGPSNLVGSIFEAGSFVVSGLPYVPHYVRLVAVNFAGAMSEPSAQVSATPAKVVADAVLDGIVKDVSLAEGAVTKAALAAGAVTQTAIAPGSIGTPQLIARSVGAEQVATRTLQAENVATGTLTGREVKALSLTGDLIAANQISAGHVKTGAITADKLESVLALTSRLIAGDPTGTRVELSESGMLVIRKDGEATFSVDASTGDVVSMGQYYTSRFGERIAMNVAGLSEPTIRAYPRRGNRYADLRSFTFTTPENVDVASWEFRLPLARPSMRSGIVEFLVYESNFAPISSSRLRFRPFVNSSGIVHPGWEATGQNVSLVFFDGRVFVTNATNSARAELVANRVTVENIVRTYDLAASHYIDDGLGNVRTPASWSRPGLKRDTAPFAERLGGASCSEIVDALDLISFRYDPARAPLLAGVTDRVRSGFSLDDLEAVAPALVRRGGARDGTDDTFSDEDIRTVLLGALQEKNREIATLRARFDDLEARLDQGAAA